jgi:hypothetical protein
VGRDYCCSGEGFVNGLLMALGVVAMFVGGMMLLSAANPSDDYDAVERVLALGLCAVAIGGGIFAFRVGRQASNNPTRARRFMANGGCLGSAIGGVAFFFLCFEITTGEGQLACLFFPAPGAALGALVGGSMAWLISRRGRPDDRYDLPPLPPPPPP